MSDWSDWGKPSTSAPTPGPSDPPPDTIEDTETDYLPPEDYFYERDRSAWDDWRSSSAPSQPQRSTPQPAATPSSPDNPFAGYNAPTTVPGQPEAAETDAPAPQSYDDVVKIISDPNTSPEMRRQAAQLLDRLNREFEESQEVLQRQTELDLGVLQDFAERDAWGEMGDTEQEQVMRALSAMTIVAEAQAAEDPETAEELMNAVKSVSEAILNDIDVVFTSTDPETGEVTEETLWERYDVAKPEGPDLGDHLLFGMGKAFGGANWLTGGALGKVLEVADVPSQLILTGLAATTSGDVFSGDFWTSIDEDDSAKYDKDSDGGLNFREALGADPDAGGRLLGAVDTAGVIATDPLTYIGMTPQVRAGLKTISATFGDDIADAVRRQGISALSDTQQQVLRETLEKQANDAIAAGGKVPRGARGLDPVQQAQAVAAERFRNLARGGQSGVRLGGKTLPGTGRVTRPITNAPGRIANLLPDNLRGSLDSIRPRRATQRALDMAQGTTEELGEIQSMGRSLTRNIQDDYAVRLSKIEKTAQREAKKMGTTLDDAARSLIDLPAEPFEAALRELPEGMARYFRTAREMLEELDTMGRAQAGDLSAPLADPMNVMTGQGSLDLFGDGSREGLFRQEAMLENPAFPKDLVPESGSFQETLNRRIKQVSQETGESLVVRAAAELTDEAGQPLMKIGKPTQQLPDGWQTRETPLGPVSGPPELLDEVVKFSKVVVDPEAMGNIAKGFANINQSWAGWVTSGLIGFGFHTRNLLGNVFNNALAGVVDPKRYARMMRLQAQGAKVRRHMAKTGKSFEAALVDVVGETDARLLRSAREQGIISSSFFTDLGDLTTPSSKAGLAVSYTLGSRNPLVSAGQKFGSAIENNARLTHFSHMLDQGMSPRLAGQSVKKYLFDYQDLTGTEFAIKNNASRFYTYMRKNTPLQLESLVSSPGAQLGLMRAEGSLFGGGEGELQPFQQEDGLVPAPGGLSDFLGFDAAVGIDSPLDAASEAVQPAITAGLLGAEAVGAPVPESLQADTRDLISDLLGMTSGGGIELADTAYSVLTDTDTFTGNRLRYDEMGNEDKAQLWAGALFPAWPKADRLIGQLFEDGLGPIGNELSERQQENNWKGALMRELLGLRVDPTGKGGLSDIAQEIAEAEDDPALDAKLDIFSGDYNPGATNADLAERLDVSASSVGRWRNEAATIHAYLSGSSAEEIAEAKGWDEDVVQRRIDLWETPGSTLRRNMMASMIRGMDVSDLLETTKPPAEAGG